MHTTNHTATTGPPEGVTAGESVPRENEVDEQTASLIDLVKTRLKHHGEPFRSMPESELEERALDILHRAGVL